MSSVPDRSVPNMSAMLLAVVAVALPMLVAGSAPPTSTYFNQALAFAGCGLWLLFWSVGPHTAAAGRTSASGATRWLMAVGVLLVAATLMPPTPWGQRLTPVACLLLAGGLMHATAATVRAGRLEDFAAPLMQALLLAGLLSLCVGLIQVFTPELAEGRWVALPTTPGRAIGNMRQPNQLSTLLLWAAAAAVWLGLRERQPLALMAVILSALVFGVALTASRTGLVGVAMLALWGVVDRRLPGRVRLLLLIMVPLYALSWWGLDKWLSAHGVMFYGEDQVKKTLHGDPSSSRGKIWANTLDLILAHPWTGVGVGAFNFIWSMTPFPGRPVAFFDHSHNVILQLAVESGIPFAVLVLSLIGWAFWCSRGALVLSPTWTFWRSAPGLPNDDDVRGARTALFMLLMVGIHSLLEYPLWYVYFLLPAAMIAGWLTGAVPVPASRQGSPRRPARILFGPVVWALTGALAVFGAMWSTAEYWTVAVIFEPELSWSEATPLPQRIALGRRSVLWGHHADYAEVTMAPEPDKVFDAFERPLYHLADTRLLVVYARALAARGELDRAEHVAARLREFHNPLSQDFFSSCDGPDADQRATPFQCLPDPGLKAERLRPRP